MPFCYLCKDSYLWDGIHNKMIKIYFAPLQGYTESAYRRAHAAFCAGVECYFSPFVRLEYGQIRRRDLRDIDADKNPYALIPQVIAASVEEFRILVDAVIEQGYNHVNINMGCPFPPQVKAGRGAGLLQHPEALKAIMDETRRYAEKGILFSVKMRIGQDSEAEGLAAMNILNEYPLEHVTIHPRLGCQQYKGAISMDGFKQLARACKHPVIYNGDISSVDDIRKIEEMFPNLHGVMIGRGLLSRPTLAAEYISGKAAADDDIRKAVLKIHSRVLEDYMQTLDGGAGQVLSKIQPFWEYPGQYFDRKIIKKMSKTGSLDNYIKLADQL